MLRTVFAAAAAVLMLAGCAGPKFVTSDVTRYNAMSESPQGKTFAIVALDDDQQSSFAFKQFGDLMNQRLSALGMRQYTGGAGPASADYVVTLRYAVYGPSADVRSTWSGFGAQAGFGYGYGWGRPYWARGPFGYMGYDPFWDDRYDITTRQVFTRRVEVNVFRGATYNSDRKDRVFEGRAVSSGLNGQIEPVMPYILDAIFQEFPGRSGETKTVSVQVPENVEKAPPRPASNSAY
ncbi:MAG: DUF4136 domain-containing protein [Rhodospirillaceae bacterium]